MQLPVAEVHVAVLAAGHAAGAAHVVGEVAIGSDPANEMSPEVAVQDAHPIPGPERICGADRYRFLAAAVVEGARDLALLVESQPALLGGAHHRHEAEQARPVLTREPPTARLGPGIFDRAHLAEPHIGRPFGSGQALGSPPPGRFRDAGISGWSRHGRRRRGIFPSSLCAYRYSDLTRADGPFNLESSTFDCRRLSSGASATLRLTRVYEGNPIGSGMGSIQRTRRTSGSHVIFRTESC